MISFLSKSRVVVVLLSISTAVFLVGFIIGYNSTIINCTLSDTNYNLTIFNILINNMKVVILNLLGVYTFSVTTLICLLY